MLLRCTVAPFGTFSDDFLHLHICQNVSSPRLTLFGTSGELLLTASSCAF